MIVIRPGDAAASHSRGVCRYAILSIPFDRLIRSSDRFDPRQTERWISGPVAVDITPASSQHAADLVGRVFKAAVVGNALASRHAQRFTADDLIGAFIAAAASRCPTVKTTGRPRAPRRRIVRRVSDFLNSMQTGFRSVADMARFVEVPERTLREVVSEEFGLPPKRLLKLRQLYDIRSALRKASLPTTVTSVAADHGVWEFGRFAGQYRQTFGEYPSETLAASRSDR
jgi:AraC family ethanolamine operon transcriptional activator